MIIYSLLAVMWIIIAIALRRTKTGGMLAGYNTMSEAEKVKINFPAVKRYLSNLFWILGMLVALAGVLPIMTDLDVSLVNRIYWPFFFIAMIGSVVYVNVSKRFKT